MCANRRVKTRLLCIQAGYNEEINAGLVKKSHIM